MHHHKQAHIIIIEIKSNADINDVNEDECKYKWFKWNQW